MLGIHYKKASPTTYVMRFTSGTLSRQGPGLSFWYLEPISTIVDIPLASEDLPFVFQEVTSDFQQITIQGQLTYRVREPERLAALLDFSVAHTGDFLSEDPAKLQLRLVNITQTAARTIVQRMSLREVLAQVEPVVEEVLTLLRSDTTIAMHGLEILGLSIISIRPTPEMGRALEAEARERLNLEADQAVYLRRNASVEEERKLKESELNTEIAVEQKKRQIRETKIAGDIAIEQQRTVLIKQKVDNDRQEADSQAYKLEVVLKPIRETDWRTLMVASGASSDPRAAISMAFQGLAENAGKIGQLNMTPDLLNNLLNPPKK